MFSVYLRLPLAFDTDIYNLLTLKTIQTIGSLELQVAC